MAKRKRDRLNSEVQPTVINVDWPVFVPNEDGSTNIEVGRARLRFGTLVVEFKDDSLSAAAIQNMIARGVLLGFGIIMLKPDVVNEMYQDVVEEEKALASAETSAIAAGLLTIDDDGKLHSVNPDQTVKEIVTVFLNLDKIIVEEPVEENNFVIVAESDELDHILNLTDNQENN